MIDIKNWILAFRPKTLTAAIVPVVAASALVYAKGYSIQYSLIIFALLSALFIQIGTNLVNDAMDFKKGADTSERIGPKRITVSGNATFKKVMLAGSFFFLLAVLLGIPLVIEGGAPILGIGIASVICGYAYTSGPFPLAYRGMGEVFVVLFFGIVAVSGMYYLLTHQWDVDAVVLGVQIGFLAAVLIAINNLRDVATDLLANKKTLAARFGENFAKYEIAFFILATFIINIYWFQKNFFLAGMLPMFLMPRGVRLIGQIFVNKPSEIYNEFLAQSAFLHILFGVLIVCGFLSKS